MVDFEYHNNTTRDRIRIKD